jgi:hypothetical protein
LVRDETIPIHGMADFMIKLDLSSLDRANESLGSGWLGVDRCCAGADICADIWGLPYPENSVDELYSSHALEYLTKKRSFSHFGGMVPSAAAGWKADRLRAGSGMVLPSLVHE